MKEKKGYDAIAKITYFVPLKGMLLVRDVSSDTNEKLPIRIGNYVFYTVLVKRKKYLVFMTYNHLGKQL